MFLKAVFKIKIGPPLRQADILQLTHEINYGVNSVETYYLKVSLFYSFEEHKVGYLSTKPQPEKLKIY